MSLGCNKKLLIILFINLLSSIQYSREAKVCTDKKVPQKVSKDVTNPEVSMKSRKGTMVILNKPNNSNSSMLKNTKATIIPKHNYGKSEKSMPKGPPNVLKIHISLIKSSKHGILNTIPPKS